MAWQKSAKYLPGVASLACGFGTGLVYAYPHTLGLDKYKDVMTDRSEDVSLNTDAEVDMAKEIKKHFKWPQPIRTTDPLFQFIPTKQLLDVSHRGSMTTLYGTVVNLPILFTTSSMQKVQENPVAYLQRYNINVDVNEAQKVLDLFNLSPDAKKFVIARELCNANSAQFYINFSGLNFLFFNCYALGYTVPRLIPFPGAAAISYLTALPLLGYFYVKVYDYFNCYMQAKSDRTAASISQSVADGGVEYYTKLLARRQTLEELQKNNIMEVYKEPEVETRFKFNMSWRKPELSLEERKARLIKASQKLYHHHHQSSSHLEAHKAETN
jgi:hypothetical protein